jgi:hypothetical protein
MACCKACCGCADCSEGQQGKCCCGGASGSCCSASEYCCSGACQGSPCDGAGYICCCCDDGVDVTCYSFDISGVPQYETDCVTGVSDPVFGNTFGDCTATGTFSYTYGECEAPPP